MRALTVRQPWAWAIVHGGKDVENRTRNVAGSYRGPVAIHAGLFERDPGFRDPTFGAAFLAASKAAETTADLEDICRGPLIRGAFVGVVDLVDVHWAEQPHAPFGAWCCQPWSQPGRFAHLVLANPRPLAQPIPARGMLGLWTPEPAVVEQLQAVTR